MVRSAPKGHASLAVRRFWLGAWLLGSCGGAEEPPLQRAERGGVSAPSSSFSIGTVPPRAARSNTPPVEPELEDAVFEEEGCEEPVERIVEMDCDPFSPDEGCSSGQACQPFVEYPEAPCEPERFGARCDWVGEGVQGDSCNFDLCASGYLCIATGQGTQCAQICRLSTPSGCPPGLVCGGLDLEGIGTCF